MRISDWSSDVCALPISGHSRSAEPIEYKITWSCIMLDVFHYCLVRHLGMVTVRIVYWIVFPLAHIGDKWLDAIRRRCIVCIAVILDEINDERVRAGRIVRWIGKSEN